MADRGRVGGDRAPNRAIRELQIKTTRAIHMARMDSINRGHGVVVNKLESRYRRPRAGAKTMTLRKERADHIALENKLLVERMKRIITHSTPVWSNDPPNSAIKIDHLSVLRPVKTSSRKKKSQQTKKGKKDNETGDAPESKGAQQEQQSLLEYSDDFALSNDDQVNPLLTSQNLEISRGSNNMLETSAVSFRLDPVSNRHEYLDESFATAPIDASDATKTHLRPSSAHAGCKPSKPANRPSSGTKRMPRPSTANAPGRKRASFMSSGDRPKSAATAPPLSRKEEEEEFEKERKQLLEKRRRSSVVSSKTGLSRLRQFERISRDNKKMMQNMASIGAYYSKADWEEDRKKQMARMERFKKFTRRKGANEKIKKVGLKQIYKFAKDNEKKIDQWEADIEERVRSEALQSAGKLNSSLRVSSRPKTAPASSNKTLTKKKSNEQLKQEYLKTKKKEREAFEKREKEEEKWALVNRKTSVAKRGIAFAASKFNNILVKNEAKRKQAHNELALLANIATADVMRTISINHGNSAYLNIDFQDIDFQNTEGIKKVRKTLVQQRQDAVLKDYILKQKQDSEKISKASKHEEKTANDYLEKALRVVSGSLDFEHEVMMMKKEKEKGSFGDIGHATIAWHQPPLVDGEEIVLRIDDPIGENVLRKGAKFQVTCEVVGEENIDITLECVEDDDDYESDDFIGTLKMIQRVPKLVIVEREAAESYAKKFLEKIVVRKKQVGGTSTLDPVRNVWEAEIEVDGKII